MKSASFGAPCCMNFAVSGKRVAGTVPVFVTWKSQEFICDEYRKYQGIDCGLRSTYSYWNFPVHTIYLSKWLLAFAGRNVGLLKEHKGFVQGVAWDPLNQYVATLSSDRW